MFGKANTLTLPVKTSSSPRQPPLLNLNLNLSLNLTLTLTLNLDLQPPSILRSAFLLPSGKSAIHPWSTSCQRLGNLAQYPACLQPATARAEV
ncbi:MAG TPA: hypothetical protein VGN63_15895 [Flavisolibacter sp.]|nr:hypothetical protein [Flavisolibacter sp.]